ncbi:MAG: cytochrome c oxidase subunit II [Pseudomonadota bacterium]
MQPTKFLGALASLPFATSAWAQSSLDQPLGPLEIIGQPEPDGINFQPAVTELARDIHWLDSFVLVIITVITLFVTVLLAYAAYKFAGSRNKTPATFTHNSTIEVAWTIIPIIILVVIGAFSLPVLFKQQRIPEGDIVIKATGYQWYWGYEYVDEGFGFDSFMIGAGENRLTPAVSAELAQAGYTDEQFLLATDTSIVIPVGKTIVMQVTAADVIHSWTIPSFGVKQDGVPGRLAQLWFTPEQEGVYFGQCSELCGQSHAYMPITVKVVSEEAYAAWLERAKEEYAGITPQPSTIQVASK